MTFAVNEPDRRKTTTLIVVAVAVVAFLLGLGLVVLLRGGGGNDGKTQAAPPTSVGLRGGDAERLTAENVQWTEIEGLRVPSSAAAGPKQVGGGRASGFSRTPAGAVVAAAQIATRAAATLGPNVYRPTVAEQVVGADKDRFLSRIEEDYRAGKAGGVTPSGALETELANAKATRNSLWAYRIDSFDPSAVSLQLLGRAIQLSGGPPVFVNFAVTLRWVDGDWRLVAPLNGDFQNTAKSLSDVPAGYTVFGTA